MTQVLEQHRPQFEKYSALIKEWQEKFNLISRNDLEKIWDRHFADAIKLAELFPDLAFRKVIDIGVGAGFPGIPLSIVNPESQFVMVESITKKCTFLEAVVSGLGLKNVSIINDRAEILGRQETHRDQYDLAIARALAHPPSALEVVLPFVKVGGAAVFWASGPDWEDRERVGKIAEILGGAYKEDKTYHLTNDERSRKLVMIAKKSATPEKFPRRPGMSEKNPL